ncbi:hypothetical protein [Actinoplanes sp. N902-109]|uniref:hypothetical protein n=1 Tax=Actinoplanes sp. (strain N902-109) TaxID=649831 RepID=UPI0012FA3638|nr:hypothetical protein [Actinoplanes sp. N902-109]
MPIFEASVRNSPRYFADAGPEGVPAVLQGALSDPVSMELRAPTEEFVTTITNGPSGS